MTVKEANKWLDRVQIIINELYKIQGACKDSENAYWEEFANYCKLSVGPREFTYVIIEGLCELKGLMREKIDNTKVE